MKNPLLLGYLHYFHHFCGKISPTFHYQKYHDHNWNNLWSSRRISQDWSNTAFIINKMNSQSWYASGYRNNEPAWWKICPCICNTYTHVYAIYVSLFSSQFDSTIPIRKKIQFHSMLSIYKMIIYWIHLKCDEVEQPTNFVQTLQKSYPEKSKQSLIIWFR